jgi:CheY-like chemotaxis protein
MGRSAPAQGTSPLDLSPVVLVADDENAILDILRVTLRADQLRVLTARDGEHALALAEAIVPEVLVTDVAMPGLDGFGLVRAIRRLYPELPVILMSGDSHYRNRPLEELAAEHGAFAVLRKPFDVDDLRQAVQGAMTLPSSASPMPDRDSKIDRAA